MSASVIPGLISGGIMLSYHCDNACRHCLYRCSPKQSDQWMSPETIDQTFSALAQEENLRGVHIAGGEAMLNPETLKLAISSAKKHNIAIDYLETNCGWCKDFDHAIKVFTDLKEHGLEAVLISASLFHNEFIPFCKTRDGIEAALYVFDGRVLIWTQEVFSKLSRLDHDKCHPLSESMKILGIDSKKLWQMHSYLTPGGRAAERLSDGLRLYPAEFFAEETCKNSLESTGHFHIDPHGNLYTGSCPGLSVANVKTGLHPQPSDTKKFTAYNTLKEFGPHKLLELCPDFTPNPKGYIHKCHLCLEIRKELFKSAKYPEITPPEYYL